MSVEGWVGKAGGGRSWRRVQQLDQKPANPCPDHLPPPLPLPSLPLPPLQAYPHHALWALAAVSKSSVATRRGAAGAIINAAKKNMDQAMFGGCWRGAGGAGGGGCLL